MKKFFKVLSIALFFTTAANAQTPEQKKAFIVQRFPGYMVDYVLQNTESVPVTEKYAKKHKKTVFQYVDLQGNGYQGSVRVGDTLVVFSNQPFYSKGQNLFMAQVVEQKKVKAPKNLKGKNENAQILGQVASNVLGVVFNNLGTRGGLVRIGQ